jgi:hypothetical protein
VEEEGGEFKMENKIWKLKVNEKNCPKCNLILEEKLESREEYDHLRTSELIGVFGGPMPRYKTVEYKLQKCINPNCNYAHEERLKR